MKDFYRLYKNKIEEKPGWNDEVLQWCLQTAQEKNLRKEDYWGGFVIDEMKIQVRAKKYVKLSHITSICTG